MQMQQGENGNMAAHGPRPFKAMEETKPTKYDKYYEAVGIPIVSIVCNGEMKVVGSRRRLRDYARMGLCGFRLLLFFLAGAV